MPDQEVLGDPERWSEDYDPDDQDDASLFDEGNGEWDDNNEES